MNNPLRALRGVALLGVAVGVLVVAWLVHGAQPEKPPAAAMLLAQAFPGWPAQGPRALQTLDLPPAPGGGPHDGPVQAWVQPLHVVAFDDDHLALVTQAVRAGEGGTPQDCHACGAVVGAYFFERRADGWHLTERQDDVLETGAAGSLGTTQVHRLEQGQYALSADWGSCWQGYCGRWLALVGLRPGHATVLSDGVRLGVDNDAIAGACSALDGRHGVPAAARRQECLQVHGSWKMQGPQLAIHFSGRLRVKGARGRMQRVHQVDEQVVYRLSASSMFLMKGRNPVPAF